MPTRIVDLELSTGIKPIWRLEGYDHLNVLVRYHRRPIGWIYLPAHKPSISIETLREAIKDQLGWALMKSVLAEEFTAQEVGKFAELPISVIVCTHNRVEQLKGCLQILTQLDYPQFEIIIVDSAPNNDETVKLVDRYPVRYLREDQPGLSLARNRGIAEARFDIVAFTDDDARPDNGWLQAIANAFANPQVMAVTGLVAPAELETISQSRFEYSYGRGQDLSRWTIQRQSLSKRELLWARYFGSGANMAFRRSLFAEIGPFDVSLGIGTPSSGADDIEMLHRLVAYGYTLTYEPAALVWHNHRRDAASLRRQIFGSGIAFGTYLLTCARNRTVNQWSIFRFTIKDWLGWWILRRKRGPVGFPRYLVALELVGAMLSPLIYKKSRRLAKRI